jgi:hypothetical protein
MAKTKLSAIYILISVVVFAVTAGIALCISYSIIPNDRIGSICSSTITTGLIFSAISVGIIYNNTKMVKSIINTTSEFSSS